MNERCNETIRPIARLLVANRGEIARRIFKTCRDLGIATVAVISDADSSEPHAREADLAVRLPGDSAADTYLRGDLIVAAAQAAGADAVHPGYGFLSENPAFAAMVLDAGLTWVGPPLEAMASMGSKIEAKALMAKAGVPVLPDFDPDGVVPPEAFPLLVKASAGGGGRGMRVARSPEELVEAVRAARAEASSVFGDATVFCEPFVEAGRHIEVQVLADIHGQTWVLGERDCSLQRRHQKVVEETPAPGLSDEARATLHAAARAGAEAIGYVGAGTVEFLVAGERHSDFWFLEMNTRLQVEHPVTECVTGLDLVALQIAVAEGRHLAGEPPPPTGHAIEARLYAEDPAADWQPQTGVVRALELPGVASRFGSPGTSRAALRLDSGVEVGSHVSVHYDPMLAKVVAWAPDRGSAVCTLEAALRAARIHGLRTNRDLLVRALRDDSFRDGDVHTGLLGQRHQAWAVPLVDGPTQAVYALAAALGRAAASVANAQVQPGVPPGWRNVPSAPASVTFTARVFDVDVVPAAQGADDRPAVVRVSWAYERGRWSSPDLPDVEVVEVTAHAVRLAHGGVVATYHVTHGPGDTFDVDGPGGAVTLRVLPRFTDPAHTVGAGSLVAPMPGAVVSVAVNEGESVSRGQTVLVLEAMKMQHTLVAPANGVVTTLRAEPGRQVAAGAVLAVIDAQEGNPDDA
ncbi:MAG: biotin carboxylase N-terminal domain-containing protein [Nocardioidaceae bacterium]